MLVACGSAGRGAFIQLSYEGYLACHANRGVMVRHPPNPEDREFITSLCQQIETCAVEKDLADITDEEDQDGAGSLEG